MLPPQSALFAQILMLSNCFKGMYDILHIIQVILYTGCLSWLDGSFLEHSKENSEVQICSVINILLLRQFLNRAKDAKARKITVIIKVNL